MKILVAHGDKEVVLEITEILKRHGLTPIPVEEGVKALQLLELERPRVAIIDVALPKIPGFEICDFLRQTEDLRDVKVLLVTSVYDKRRYRRPPASLYGADDLIESHDIKDTLMPKVRGLLERRKKERMDRYGKPQYPGH